MIDFEISLSLYPGWSTSTDVPELALGSCFFAGALATRHSFDQGGSCAGPCAGDFNAQGVAQRRFTGGGAVVYLEDLFVALHVEAQTLEEYR